MEAFIQVMESTLALKDPYTVVHQRQVTRIARTIGQALGLSEDRLRDLCIAGALHDLGKMAIPSDLLAKSGKLNHLEFALLKTHPQVAYNLLKPIKLPGNTAEIILQHHERLDGSGYPRGLTGHEIFLEARILGVADVLEAMCSHRPYRASLGLTLTLEELTRHQGILYDAAVVEIGLQLYAPGPVGQRGGDLRLDPHRGYSPALFDPPHLHGPSPTGPSAWWRLSLVWKFGAPRTFQSHRAALAGTIDEGMLHNHLIAGHNPVHEPVMVGEVLVGLNCRSGRLYVDGTVGEGGHAAAILDRIGPEGELWGLDRDPNALKAAAARLAHHTSKFQLFQRSYAQLGELLEAARLPGVAGILLDLGLSSFAVARVRARFFFCRGRAAGHAVQPGGAGAHGGHLVKPRLRDGVGKDFPGVWRGAPGPAHRPPGGAGTAPAPLPDDPSVGEIVGTGPGTRGAQGETASSYPGLPGLTHSREPGVGRAGRLSDPRPGLAGTRRAPGGHLLPLSGRPAGQAGHGRPGNGPG